MSGISHVCSILCSISFRCFVAICLISYFFKKKRENFPDEKQKCSSVLQSMGMSNVSKINLFLFQVLSRLVREFDHDVPNCRLNDMNTVADVIDFFETEVSLFHEI